MALTRPRSYQLLDSDIKASCRAVTAASVTLSGGAPDVLDSLNLVVGDRILVKDQATGSQNGIYVVQTVGNGSNGTWVRASDFNATNKISSGIIVYIEEGTVYSDRVYSLTTDNPITLGSTSLAWSLISSAGGGTTPGGSSGHIQFNSSSLFAGNANLTFDGSNVDLSGYIDAANLRVGASGNTISSTDTNGNILLTPNGTGVILANANVTAPVFISNIGPGTAPFVIASTTQVANLNVATAGTAATVTTAAQPNITSVGTLSSLGVTGAVTASTLVSNIAIGTAPFTVTSTTQVANLNVATAGSATTAGTVTTAAQPNITSVGTLTGLTVSGSIVPNANGTIQLGGTSARWSNIWGLSSSAQYADLAENYESDAHYDPATVVVFGGDMEITTSTITHDPKVAGVISTQPAYLMNDDSSRSGTWLPVALQGRVPCKVKGPVSKGDIVVTSDIPGVAEKINKILYEPGSVIGKSLEHHLGTDIKIIEVVVGRF